MTHHPDVKPQPLLSRRARDVVLTLIGRSVLITAGVIGAAIVLWAIDFSRFDLELPVDSTTLALGGAIACGLLLTLAIGRAIVVTLGGARTLRGSVEDAAAIESRWRPTQYWLSVNGRRFRVDADVVEGLYLGQQVLVRYRPGLPEALDVSAIGPTPAARNAD